MVGNIKDETVGLAIKEFAEVRPNMYSFLVDDSSNHKKTSCVSEIVLATIIPNKHIC